ncbi:MAG: YccF domain-containing protein [Firmicutes bacterium HGW-Firmicutes-7]|nr:MAG: YccF domain-containing protein [Firmicutes bacterium HGW-Firmicutes-7]
MGCLGNIVWIVFGGLISAVMWLLCGLLCCVTVVGIPFGLQCFKIAGLVLAPFGRDVQVGEFGAGGLIGNVIWLIVLGWELALSHLVFAALFCVTIVGIPFGLQHIKLAKLALLPFGARIY